MKARDVMTAGVIAVSANAPVDQVARLLTMYRIRSVPVVGPRNEVVGIVREDDLFVRERGAPFSMTRIPTLFNECVDLHRLPEIYEEVRGRRAVEVMSDDVVCVDAEEDVGRVVALMMKRHTGQVLVMHDGELAGIITRSDLVGLLAGTDST
jgi:CBS domain-containing protein